MHFLQKIFTYFDVMIALSLNESPLFLLNHPPPVQSGVDDTFGLAGSLWPLMYRLADLLAKLRRGEAVAANATELECVLWSWTTEHRASPAPATKHDANWQAMVQIALSYKYTGLLALYKSGLCHSSDETHLKKMATGFYSAYRPALDSLLRVCVLSGSMCTLTWPLYTVAMNADSDSDRTLLCQIFDKFHERQHMRVVLDAKEKVSQHWDSQMPPFWVDDEVFLG
jgi:hypothetical protein